ncbi:MAG: hypothetical protein DRN15_02895 [Thermoprotei archaeon]|nr:MAG: hypothetical protein DRM97_08235 [Thermoprotei archaeon]RLF24351.1 MAG: hypothetical protein DRN15_02895 [Thermoprotei archaeon]
MSKGEIKIFRGYVDAELNKALSYDIVVVVDVLRAGTTVVTALANGALKVIPVESLEKCRSMTGCILCGEENSFKIKGFHLGNSPLEYVYNKLIKGKVLVLKTTNFSSIASKCLARHKNVIIGAFINFNAVADTIGELYRKGAKIAFIECGNRGKESFEDRLFCEFLEHYVKSSTLPIRNSLEIINMVMAASDHAKELANKGFLEDIGFSLTLSIYEVVPWGRNDGFVVPK